MEQNLRETHTVRHTEKDREETRVYIEMLWKLTGKSTAPRKSVVWNLGGSK
jgi:hypothetical protein